MHLADAFIQSDLQYILGYTFSLVHVFPGNRTHNLLRWRRNALSLSHRNTIIQIIQIYTLFIKKQIPEIYRNYIIFALHSNVSLKTKFNLITNKRF